MGLCAQTLSLRKNILQDVSARNVLNSFYSLINPISFKIFYRFSKFIARINLLLLQLTQISIYAINNSQRSVGKSNAHNFNI